AEIVSVFLYDESTHTYYAPFATGQPQESLLDSLTDMREQLARYLNDERQGKAPDELGVHQYGSTVWLTVTRQRLVARDAPAEIDSTFIRRYQVQSTIGLPLLAGERFLGLIYLNYRSRERAPDDNKLHEVERRDPSTLWEAALSKTVGETTAESDLHPVATYALGQPDEPHGYLIVVSRDSLATVRRAHATDEMLKAGAQLIGSALASQRLIAELENSNRLLSALGDMTAAMLKPGASRHEVIDAVVGHLTDSEVPEFDFNFATVYPL